MANRYLFLGRSILTELPERQRGPETEERLLGKYHYTCHICGEKLPSDISRKTVQADHILPRAHGGETKLSNLFVAHKQCNHLRRDLDLEDAQQLVPLRLFCEKLLRDGERPTFRLFRTRYMRWKTPPPIAFNARGRRAYSRRLGTSGARISEDPSTGVRYFYANVPVGLIQNDEHSQPRYLEWDHITSLYQNFQSLPVHEPSAARLVRTRSRGYRLLQFDGQHKTTAQILLDRPQVQMKVYLDPPQRLVNDLVMAIQQDIPKRPLSTTASLSKTRTLVEQRIRDYSRHCRRNRSEQDFFEWLGDGSRERKAAWKQYLFYRAAQILLDRRMALEPYMKIIRMDVDKVTTDKRVVSNLLMPLMHSNRFDDYGFGIDYSRRNLERRNILQVLSYVERHFLEGKWYEGDEVARQKAKVFMLGGAMKVWVSWGVLMLFPSQDGGLARRVSKREWSRLDRGFRELWQLPIWTRDPDPRLRDHRDILTSYKAFSSNRPKDVPDKIVRRIVQCFN